MTDDAELTLSHDFYSTWSEKLAQDRKVETKRNLELHPSWVKFYISFELLKLTNLLKYRHAPICAQ